MQISRALFAFALIASAMCIPAGAHAVDLSYECDYIIPYQAGAGTNLQLGCYRMKPDWERGLCISSCKRKCEQYRKACEWDLNDLTQCYLGCENGPRVAILGEMVEEAMGSAAATE